MCMYTKAYRVDINYTILIQSYCTCTSITILPYSPNEDTNRPSIGETFG